jgi:hypothetical protein
MNKEDLKIVNFLKKKKKKYPEFRFFVASKRGGNAKGAGKDRSVILGRLENNGNWQHVAKIWGKNDEERARNIVAEASRFIK